MSEASQSARGRGVLFKFCRAVVPHDGAGNLVALALFVALDLGDWRVLTVLSALRLAASIAWARHLLEPVRRWAASGTPSEPVSRAAELALHRFERRYLSPYVIGWLLSLAITVAARALTLPLRVVVGATELLVGGAMTIVLPTVFFIVIGQELRGVIRPIQGHVAAALLELGLEPRQIRDSMRRILNLTMVGYLFVIGVSVGLVGISVHAWDLRELELARQSRAAELAAVHVAHGELSQIEAGVELVGPEALPALLADQLPSAAPLTAIDPPAGEVMAAAPTGDGRWALATTIADEHIERSVLLLALLAVFVSIRGRLVARGLARTQTEPIEQVAAQMREVCETGATPASRQLPTARDDEIGRLIAEFNHMLEMLADFARAAEAIAAGDLRASFDQPGPLYASLSAMLARLRDVVARLRETASELSETAAELHAATEAQRRVSDEQSSRAGTISENVGSLTTAAVDITETAERVRTNAEQTVSQADAAAARIVELGEVSEALTELLGQIREIGERSDLLALNGSLEATRAGEAGRGFALVAAEMRRLAERVNLTVDDAATRLGEIDRARARTIEANAANRALAESTAAAARDISSLAERQSHDTELVASRSRPRPPASASPSQASRRSTRSPRPCAEKPASSSSSWRASSYRITEL